MQPKYTTLERLGGGGQAEVFRGISESLQGFKRVVAIKRVLPHLTNNAQFVAMFLDEARLSLFLSHTNVVSVFDIAKAEDGNYILIMEYVDGCDLKAMIEHQNHKHGRVEMALAVFIIIECCKGLYYAHTLEHPDDHTPLHIVHRDISPPNIMMSKNGEVKVVDFGLAKANSQVEITDQGIVKGKFSYLSPEAASGLEIDARTDVFALGIILWEMLTGRRLFLADKPIKTIELVREARIPSITALNPTVPVELDMIVRKALARAPHDRYQTAADLGDALAHFLFAREMKATSRDIARAVRDTKIDKERRASPKDSLIDALVKDELNKLVSMVEEEVAACRVPMPLEAGEQIDLHGWATDLED
ncbi:MAG: serine/threonine protein kinase [Deltaproteobacteria bacterium]|nr:serine/threonine protein kinase [Deltaproteobacteria bacterium]